MIGGERKAFLLFPRQARFSEVYLGYARMYPPMRRPRDDEKGRLADRRGVVLLPRFPYASIFWVVGCLVGWWATEPLSSAQAGALSTVPPLSSAFPLLQQGSEVHVASPVALNERVVIRPNARLHFLYVRPQRRRAANGGEAPARRRRGGAMPLGGMGMGGMGLGGLRMGTTSGPSSAPHRDAQPRPYAIDRKTVWTSCAAFREALSELPGSDLRLVFSLPAPIIQDAEPVEEGEEELLEEARRPSRPIRDEPLDLPLGLLLTQRKGAPTVLAVEEGSVGERAGLRARDRIVSLDGRSSPKSLAGFLTLYRQEKTRGLKELTLAVERAGQRTPLSVTVSLPPRLEGSILDLPAE